VYRNSVDALRNLLSVEHSTSEVNQISAKIWSMQNAIAYCVVQVSFANGEEYASRNMEESEELCKAARERSELLCLH
jgi:hypothetical protein